MHFDLVPIEAPTSYPVSLEEAKEQLRVTSDREDNLIIGYIAGAADYCQKRTSRQFLTATYRVTFDRFPHGCFNPCREWSDTNENAMIEIPLSPVQSVEEVGYVNTDGDEVVLDEDTYLVTGTEPARITPAPGTVWPCTQIRPAAVWVEFTAGFGRADDVPQPVKQAIQLIVAHWMEHRPAVSELQYFAVPLGVDSLLGVESMRVYR